MSYIYLTILFLITTATAKPSNRGRPRGKYYDKKLHHNKYDAGGAFVAG